MNEVFINRRVFSSKGERLSVYGKIVDLWKMEITVIRCSLSDQFKKKIADELYNEGRGFKYVIDLPTLDHPGKQFNIFCKYTFYSSNTSVTKDLKEFLGFDNILHSKKDRKIIIKY